ncbi:hypothetical protein [Fructilactobacillus carniphilus]|uniref:Uncharacterized protein n=1 Tax=Fructilactobacillus carniphilus TaxID=2940297 RepID=A0ABY5BXT1_9LACO|nr:hypothetical protein [Fructilactobacillus carniphilus]USS90645.1 hypothetical protein M3M37_07395 [Fructilactobacillus carniphilus]
MKLTNYEITQSCLKEISGKNLQEKIKKIRSKVNPYEQINWKFILSGAISYFSNLDQEFLGISPTMHVENISSEMDHFFNWIYRLENVFTWFKYQNTSSSFKELIALRTLIYHAGQQVNLKEFNLQQFKNTEFDYIKNYDEKQAIPNLCNDKYDYVFSLLSRKIKPKDMARLDSSSDVSKQNENTCITIVGIVTKDIKDVLLNEIDNFINFIINDKEDYVAPNFNDPKKFPSKNAIIADNSINIDRLGNVIRNHRRGGYIKERYIEEWGGYGLQKILNYVKNDNSITSKKIKEVISNSISRFYDEYRNPSVDNIYSLDFRNVFSNFLPKYENDVYFGNKIHDAIAIYFNSKDPSPIGDQEYTQKFIKETEQILGKKYKYYFSQTPDLLICEYIYNSVQKINA